MRIKLAKYRLNKAKEILKESEDSFWRHRLGVRIDGSQPSDRGSNPRGATSLT